MNFDELFKYCQELNNSNAEKCLVCHIPVENYDKHIKLKCTHIFHSECVKYKDGSLKCLYCEKTSVPDKINWNTNILAKPNEISCKLVLKSGPRKGQFCNRINCLYHKLNQSAVIKVINPTTSKQVKINKIKTNTKTKTNKCNHIIKTGIKAGQMCNRDTPCKYHNKENKNETKIETKNKPNNIIINKCKHIIKSGFDTGKECGRDLPCKYHKNKVISVIPSIEDNHVLPSEEEELIEV